MKYLTKTLHLVLHMLFTLAAAIFLTLPLISLVTVYYWFHPEPIHPVASREANEDYDEVWFDCESLKQGWI